LRNLSKKPNRESRRDPSIHTYWPNLIILELAQIKELDLTVESIYKHLKGRATRREINLSLEFLTSRKILEPIEGTKRFKIKPYDFVVLNDKRRVDILNSHLRFLDMAKQQVFADRDDRCLQGLTVAASADKIWLIKERLYQLIDE